ncbi:unnamed protein product [Medioppia subpectinata]|uniref:Uncharacterized protein n=1 Tax=Medioppia subpectinata TaxID=1979941 RepID=A0A7R9PVI9_9ACAR|nr:unnamed protein product [Medioppia subpectinata]CAG2102338.1 unnamed protein product [Medioppia subpectinata]
MSSNDGIDDSEQHRELPVVDGHEFHQLVVQPRSGSVSYNCQHGIVIGGNRTSMVLSRERNEQLFALLEPYCRSLSTTVCKFKHRENNYAGRESVVCLIKDHRDHRHVMYSVRVYDLNWGECVYRATITSEAWFVDADGVVSKRDACVDPELIYQVERSPWVHKLTTSGAAHRTVILRFVDESEANYFQTQVEAKVELMRRKREVLDTMAGQRAGQSGANGSGGPVCGDDNSIVSIDLNDGTDRSDSDEGSVVTVKHVASAVPATQVDTDRG